MPAAGRRATTSTARRAPDIIYLDNNATTAMCKAAITAMHRWLDIPANPSSSSRYGVAAKKMMDDGRAYILAHCSAPNYLVVYTSGASESNSFIIRSTVAAYFKQRKAKPHVLTSLTEHKSIIKCCEELEAAGAADITYIAPAMSGCIPPQLIERGIRPNTCLVSIMSANNELGCINNLREIGTIAHAHKVPMHADCVQTFGKFKYSLPANNIDAISVSFHKLHGPKGCGLLVVNRDLVDGYGLEGMIAGTQEYGLRGGTENVACIAGGLAAMKHTFVDRAAKNARLYGLRAHIISKLGAHFGIGDYKTYVAEPQLRASGLRSGSAPPEAVVTMHAPASATISARKPVELIILGTPSPKINQSKERRVLPGTILLAIAKNTGTPFCNTKLKAALERLNIIVSIGSACNTASPDASHVLAAIRAPDVILRGVIRVSMCDDTTKKDADAFISAFIQAVDAQLKELDSSAK